MDGPNDIAADSTGDGVQSSDTWIELIKRVVNKSIGLVENAVVGSAGMLKVCVMMSALATPMLRAKAHPVAASATLSFDFIVNLSAASCSFRAL
jgi:hypothetical protein